MKNVRTLSWMCALFMAATVCTSAQTPDTQTIRPLLWQPGMAPSELGEVNVSRRFSSERTVEMTQFYGEVLGLTALPSSALGGGQMIRYPVGASEVKLFPSPPDAANSAGVGEVIGVRLLTFFFADEETLTARFRDHGYPDDDQPLDVRRRSAEGRANRGYAISRLERRGRGRSGEGARRNDRSTALGPGPDAHDLAARPGRRQQLFR